MEGENRALNLMLSQHLHIPWFSIFREAHTEASARSSRSRANSAVANTNISLVVTARQSAEPLASDVWSPRRQFARFKTAGHLAPRSKETTRLFKSRICRWRWRSAIFYYNNFQLCGIHQWTAVALVSRRAKADGSCCSFAHLTNEIVAKRLVWRRV